MTMLERWKRYAARIECDYCGTDVNDFNDHPAYDTDAELADVVRVAWINFGFDEATAPEPSRDYFDKSCDGCRQFITKDD